MNLRFVDRKSKQSEISAAKSSLCPVSPTSLLRSHHYFDAAQDNSIRSIQTFPLKLTSAQYHLPTVSHGELLHRVRRPVQRREAVSSNSDVASNKPKTERRGGAVRCGAARRSSSHLSKLFLETTMIFPCRFLHGIETKAVGTTRHTFLRLGTVPSTQCSIRRETR